MNGPADRSRPPRPAERRHTQVLLFIGCFWDHPSRRAGELARVRRPDAPRKPCKIPQVRIADRPHKNPTFQEAYRPPGSSAEGGQRASRTLARWPIGIFESLSERHTCTAECRFVRGITVGRAASTRICGISVGSQDRSPDPLSGYHRSLVPTNLWQARWGQRRNLRRSAADRRVSRRIDRSVPFGTSFPACTGTVVARPSGCLSR
jgi:hypothetical protein